jgi:hypothetical protein
MPEEVEIETQELQETIEELHEEREERKAAEKKAAWTRYIALSTAILAVFAAIGAMQSGALVNEAMIDQIKASDKWNEYQAARQKDHLYTIKANDLLDQGAKAPAPKEPAEGGTAGALPVSLHGEGEKPAASPPKENGHPAPRTSGIGDPWFKERKPGEAGKKPGKGEKASEGEKKPAEHGTKHGEKKAAAPEKKTKSWKNLTPEGRLAQYIGKVDDESSKEEKLKSEAEKLEEESQHKMHIHHKFAYAVALIQVAIALSAVAALTRIKPVWAISLVAGAIGIVMFLMGLSGH